MDGVRFDAWTRRRFGMAAAGLATLLSPLAARDIAAKKKRKKRCLKLGRVCEPGGKRKCCKKLKCRLTLNNVGFSHHCCKTVGATCASFQDCCSGFCLDDRCQPDFCKEVGGICDQDADCCSNNCNEGQNECEP